MGATYDEIRGFLDEKGYKYKTHEEGFILTAFGTRTYRDPDGDGGVNLVIRLREDGEYFEVFAPKAYMYPDGPNKAALMQVLAMVQWRTKLIQFEYDASDGEVRPIIEFPLEDSKLTSRQFHRVLGGIVQLLEEYHPVIQKAIETGEIDFPERDGIADVLAGATPEEIRQVIEELRRRKSGPREL